MRALLFHNPDAGTADHEKDDLVALVGRTGYGVTYCSTKDAAFPGCVGEPADLVVIAGGDGTVASVVAHMPDRSIPVVILPQGGANNVARALGITRLPERLAVGRDARRQRFDVGIASGPWGTRPFVEAVGCGALAAAMAAKGDEAEKAPGKAKLLRGREAFLHRVAKQTPRAMTIDVDGRALSGAWILVEATCVRFTGPGLLLSPEAEPGDGLLDLLCVGEDERAALEDWVAAPDGSAPPGIAVRGRRIRFEWDGKPALRIDDALAEPPDDREPAAVTVALQDRPLTILLPAEGAGADAGAARGGRRVKRELRDG